MVLLVIQKGLLTYMYSSTTFLGLAMSVTDGEEEESHHRPMKTCGIVPRIVRKLVIRTFMLENDSAAVKKIKKICTHTCT